MSRLTNWFSPKKPQRAVPPVHADPITSGIVAFYDAMDNYDEVSGNEWLGPNLSFGLLYPHLRSGHRICDLGVGTGLGAALFVKAGCSVIGLDASRGMLDQCARKGVCDALYQHDLNVTPYPVETASADHVVAGGVLHFIPDLDAAFAEVSRIIRPGGHFHFDVARILHPDRGGAREGIATGSGHRFMFPPEEDVRSGLARNGFSVVARTPFYFFDEALDVGGDVVATRLYFDAFLARKSG